MTKDQWHTLTAEFLDQHVLIHIDGKHFTYAHHKGLDVRKSSFKFGMAGPLAQLDDIHVYRATSHPGWLKVKDGLLKR